MVAEYRGTAREPHAFGWGSPRESSRMTAALD